jgi:RNA polymerase sigma factor (sigma-70 family)
VPSRPALEALLAAVPSIGRANRVERSAAPGADVASDLYERWSAQIFGYCLHQLGSREEAEDAVQTTFMNAMRGLARGVVPEVEQAWLFKIAHNVCLSRRRSSWRRGRVEAPNNMEVLQEIVPARERRGDELIRLQDVLEEMPEGQRRAILLRDWQGLSYREIADELELSQGAVETLIFRARRALASGLEEAPSFGRLRNRARRGADVGGVLAFVKSMLDGGGTAAVKVATMVALAGVAVATTTADHPRPEHRAPAVSKESAVAVPVAAHKPLSSASAPLSSDVSSVPPRETASSGARRRPKEHPPAAAPTTPRPRTPAPAPPASAPETSTLAPAAPTPTATAVVEAADAPAPQPAPPTPAPKPEKGQGNHEGGRPVAAPPAKPNPGNGRAKDQPVEQASPVAAVASAPDAAEDPEKSTPPGRENKAEKDDKGGNGGNGSAAGGNGNGRGK